MQDSKYEQAMAEQSIHALWNDGKTAKAYPVRLYFFPETNEVGVFTRTSLAFEVAVLSREAADELWPCSAMSMISEKRELPLHFTLQPEMSQHLTISDPAAAKAVLGWWRPHAQTRQKKVRKRWLIGAAIMWGLVLALYTISPIIFDALAKVTPRSWEEQIGKSSHDQLVSMYGLLIKNGAVKEGHSSAIDTLMGRLKAAEPDDDYTYRVTVLDSPIVNAMALPGGYIIVFSGLIDSCDSPDELAGVLAHEMAHVTRKHGLSLYFSSYLWSFFARLGGNSESFGGKLSSIMVVMVNSSYTRTVEQEADLLAVRRLMAAHISSEGLIRFFGQMANKAEQGIFAKYIPLYLQSHPELALRQQYVAKEIATYGPQKYTPALSEPEWLELKTTMRTTVKKPKRATTSSVESEEK